MTLPEFLIAGLLLALLIVLAAEWMRSVRRAARRELAIDILASLSAALDQYHATAGAWPEDTATRSSDSALRALQHVPAAARLMAPWQTRRADGAAASAPDAACLVDPWGTPLRYLGPRHGGARVTANTGKPIFVSAGPDRDFGDAHAVALGDNLASDDPLVIERGR